MKETYKGLVGRHNAHILNCQADREKFQDCHAKDKATIMAELQVQMARADRAERALAKMTPWYRIMVNDIWKDIPPFKQSRFRARIALRENVVPEDMKSE